MFPRRELPGELGGALRVFRPHRVAGWILPGVPAVPLVLLAAVGPPGPPVGLGTLLLLGVPPLHGFAEWFLRQHRVHEHGLVPRTERHGTYTYVIPFAAIDADSSAVFPRTRIDRDDAWAERASLRWRHNPLLGHPLLGHPLLGHPLLGHAVAFTALDPDRSCRPAEHRIPRSAPAPAHAHAEAGR
ncbi:hypothetical protein DSC45_22550 [Streptomyces sp. YIM 130001]|uniref:hypothetical protein n=1 Tax=Streptomyces sp. YIM 130001 TaxID=2259644 RepID=UPI000EE69921|nr:hypothetical protein [Streptomyces sp. YIM 130001]RII13737.1 hypothetical protein DSC45_22550 [Streptomyces sp. YIM 130001]